VLNAKPENVEIEVEMTGRSFEHSLLLTVLGQAHRSAESYGDGANVPLTDDGRRGGKAWQFANF
ncbi:hypothetical protein CCACVL1_28288, partial [Corchorus capsularis]